MLKIVEAYKSNTENQSGNIYFETNWFRDSGYLHYTMNLV